MHVHRDEGVANYIGPEPCADTREGAGDASAGSSTRTTQLHPIRIVTEARPRSNQAPIMLALTIAAHNDHRLLAVLRVVASQQRRCVTGEPINAPIRAAVDSARSREVFRCPQQIVRLARWLL